MIKKVLEVDIFDNPIGLIKKTDAHKLPILHRAFSVFLYNQNKLLIQKRTKHKYHSGGLWANSCCSHPISDNIIQEAKTRVKEEIGIEQDSLKELFCFTYFYQFEQDLFEFEFDHVLVGQCSQQPQINLDEVEACEWIEFDELEKLIAKKPQMFAPWFIICAPKVIEILKNDSSKYLT